MKGEEKGKVDEREKEKDKGLPQPLQREIANLGVRFQVSLDPLHHPSNQTIHLVCKLGMKLKLKQEAFGERRHLHVCDL